MMQEPLRERLLLSEVPPSEYSDRVPEKSGGIPVTIPKDCGDWHRAHHTPTRARGTVADMNIINKGLQA